MLFGDLSGFVERRAAAGSLEIRATRTFTAQIGGGVGHGGRLVVDGVHHEFLPGWLATLAGSWRVVDGGDRVPFVLLTASIGGSGARTRVIGQAETESYLAFDARFGVAAGWTLFDALSPYLAARAFGGPILWRFRGEDRFGTDRYHYQLALGASALLPGGFNVLAEGVPLGERGATASVGAMF